MGVGNLLLCDFPFLIPKVAPPEPLSLAGADGDAWPLAGVARPPIDLPW